MGLTFVDVISSIQSRHRNCLKGSHLLWSHQDLGVRRAGNTNFNCFAKNLPKAMLSGSSSSRQGEGTQRAFTQLPTLGEEAAGAGILVVEVIVILIPEERLGLHGPQYFRML